MCGTPGPPGLCSHLRAAIAVRSQFGELLAVPSVPSPARWVCPRFVPGLRAVAPMPRSAGGAEL